MPNSTKKTSFNPQWILKDKFKTWVGPVEKDPFSAFCKLCKKRFALSNMGEQALTSHMNGKKHQQSVSDKNSSISLLSFCSKNKGVEGGRETHCFDEEKLDPTPNTSSTSTSSSSTTAPLSQSQLIQNQPRGLLSMLVRDEVTKAEIIWCLHIVMSHSSGRSGGSGVELFPLMFPDSQIASKMKLQRTKISYVISFGLASYFKRELLDICDQCELVVVGFDESLNKVAQKGQMDVCVRFWNKATNQVCTRYFSSSFLGHGTAKDLLRSFLEATKGLDLNKLLQVSMDGPNVNKKFHQELMNHMKEIDGNIERPNLLNLGSCGLHTLHNAFKKAMNKTDWNIIKFLRSLYYLFSYCPARREDYIKFSGSSLFPLKFCPVRWVENFNVAQRASKILPNVIKYVEGVKENKIEPDSSNFKVVSSFLTDKLLSAKLAYFQTIASEVEPFLTNFQSNAPLSPLLYEALVNTLRRIMSRFVKEEILNSSKSLSAIDLRQENNLIPVKHIDLGFSVRCALRFQKNVKDGDILHFRIACRNGLIEFCSALFKLSPLSYPLTRAISCFDPQVVTSSQLRLSRLTRALDIFIENRWICGTQADKIKNSFSEVCKLPLFTEIMQNFAIGEARLDDLWLSIIPKGNDFGELRNFLKMILILSHGNAFCERGFSINKEILIENLSEESLIAQRVVYDAISNHGGVNKVDINKKVIQYARNASALYRESLSKKLEQRNTDLEAEKRKADDAIKHLESKKQKVLEESRRRLEEIDEEIKKVAS